MVTPAVDYEGSGDIHYLRADMAEHRVIRLVMAEWSAYVEHSNSFTLPRTITITVASIIGEFEARTNLGVVTAAIRSRAEKLTAADLAAAESAFGRLESRKNEKIDIWTDSLSADLSLHRD
jgi:hypothetical protein